MNVAEALSKKKPVQSVSDSARLDCEVLLAFVLSKPREYLFTWPEHELTHSQEKHYLDLIDRRLAGEPIAYIIGRRDFWNLSLKVNNSTLIPRPDTECLVEHILEKFDHAPRCILELGTGSGAIALALASERPGWAITACDISQEALDVAEYNRSEYDIKNIHWLHSHWFDSVSGAFDIIVSNPPYIDKNDQHLGQGDVRFEPRSALVASDNGLGDIRSISVQAKQFLSIQGYLFFEHGWQQANSVREILLTEGYQDVASFQDYSGNDRNTGGYWYGK